MTPTATIVSAVLLMALAPIDFRAQEVPGLRVESPGMMVETSSLSARQVDLDGDGALDLVFSREVSFQRDGLFPREARAPLPTFTSAPHLDVWGREIYLRFGERLRVIRWEDAAWRTRLDHPMSWPAADNAVPGRANLQGAVGPTALITRFLHDLDADGVPEIVLAAPDGIHIYAELEQRFHEAGVLNVLPPLACSFSTRPRLWPTGRRLLEFPVQSMQCRLIIEGPRIGVLVREEARGNRVRYRLGFRPFLKDGSGRFSVEEPGPAIEQTQSTEWLPAYMEPCRLNEDDVLDLAGSHWDTTHATAFPVPVHTASISLDAGKTIREYRTVAFRPGTSLLDFDGDGDLDLIAASSEFFDGGARELLARFLTRSAVSQTLRIYSQTAGTFAGQARLTHHMKLDIELPPLLESPSYQRYRRGTLVSLAGDFNGDGYRDLLVQDRPGRLAIFLAAGYSFPDSPDAVIPTEPNCLFAAADVNGDGLSDIVMRWTPAQAARNVERNRVYFARETAR